MANTAGLVTYNAGLSRPSSSEYLYDFCFNAAFSHALLDKGYGLATNGTPIKVVGKIEGSDVSWAYGSMLYEVNRSRTPCVALNIVQ